MPVMSTSTSNPAAPAIPAGPSDAEVTAAIATLKAAGFRRVQQAGYHFQVRDFYSSCNDVEFLDANRDLWQRKGDPLGIDWNLPRQLEVAREVAGYIEELRDIPQHSDDVRVFCWRNPFFNSADALVHYGLFRSRKPRRVVEVGCGWSSLLLARALNANEASGSHRAEVTQIEPYPRRELMSVLPKHWTMHESIIQRAPLEIFEKLGAGDILFYDGSHVAKCASDVNWFFFEVLPRLASGVLIHVHDIFFPHDYPEQWMFERGQTWNEQYVLQALLMGGDRYRVEIANRLLCVHHQATLDSLYKGLQPSFGCSLWMMKA
jgi:predicted O-methyltransferase YrrM